MRTRILVLGQRVGWAGSCWRPADPHRRAPLACL